MGGGGASLFVCIRICMRGRATSPLVGRTERMVMNVGASCHQCPLRPLAVESVTGERSEKEWMGAAPPCHMAVQLWVDQPTNPLCFEWCGFLHVCHRASARLVTLVWISNKNWVCLTAPATTPTCSQHGRDAEPVLNPLREAPSRPRPPLTGHVC